MLRLWAERSYVCEHDYRIFRLYFLQRDFVSSVGDNVRCMSKFLVIPFIDMCHTDSLYFSRSRRRGLNPPYRVKSISMTSFTPQEIEFLQGAGNEVESNYVFEVPCYIWEPLAQNHLESGSRTVKFWHSGTSTGPIDLDFFNLESNWYFCRCIVLNCFCTSRLRGFDFISSAEYSIGIVWSL